ncbi:MAG TPA: twin-arginine translocase TatA/TatE family subunit [Sedimentisphaerales bacterium]|nr:twin-arginine translocase TatA/TatE family subunit [Sedimentisphaerales bacterium]
MNGLTFDMLGMWTPGPFELVIIAIVALLIFGRRLPEIARSVGKSLTEFKKGLNEANETKDDVMKEVNKAKDDIVNETKEAAGFKNLDK